MIHREETPKFQQIQEDMEVIVLELQLVERMEEKLELLLVHNGFIVTEVF